jgi:hypothetical protein
MRQAPDKVTKSELYAVKIRNPDSKGVHLMAGHITQDEGPVLMPGIKKGEAFPADNEFFKVIGRLVRVERDFTGRSGGETFTI